MASARPKWEPIGDREVKEWRRDLPKGAIRETNTAHTLGYDQADSDGDMVALEAPSVTPLTALASPREVAEEVFGQVWEWARGSRESFQLMAQIVRNNNPEAYGHLSDDELATKIEQHAKDAGRKATEEAFDDHDRGNDLDMWQGKVVTP